MRSLYVRILIATVATVALSLAAFVVITRMVIGKAVSDLFQNAYTIQADQAASRNFTQYSLDRNTLIGSRR